MDGVLACALVTFDSDETAVMPDGSECWCTDYLLPDGEYDRDFLICLDDDCAGSTPAGTFTEDPNYGTLYCTASYGCQGTIDDDGECVDVPECATEWSNALEDGSTCICPADYIPADALDMYGYINKEAEFIGFGVAPIPDLYDGTGYSGDSVDYCLGIIGGGGYSSYF